MLADLVKAGKLPPVEQRLPAEPVVIKPTRKIGKYGGTLTAKASTSTSRTTCRSATPPACSASTTSQPSDAGRRLELEVQPRLQAGTITLRKGMKWSDGTPFTTDDVMFWLRRHASSTRTTRRCCRHWAHQGGQPMKYHQSRRHHRAVRLRRAQSCLLPACRRPAPPSSCLAAQEVHVDPSPQVQPQC